MADVLMVAKPREHSLDPESRVPEEWYLGLYAAEEFFRNERLYGAHTQELWKHFHNRGKYATIEKCTRFFGMALARSSEGFDYLGSCCVVSLGEKWIIEYVMVKTDFRNRGIGSAIMNFVMRQARKRNAQWVILNCDPERENGKLLRFYQKFGFAVVA